MVALLIDIEEASEREGQAIVLSDERALARRLLITGASRGIGRHLALHYLGLGDTVTGCARSAAIEFAVCFVGLALVSELIRPAIQPLLTTGRDRVLALGWMAGG